MLNLTRFFTTKSYTQSWITFRDSVLGIFGISIAYAQDRAIPIHPPSGRSVYLIEPPPSSFFNPFWWTKFILNVTRHNVWVSARMRLFGYVPCGGWAYACMSAGVCVNYTFSLFYKVELSILSYSVRLYHEVYSMVFELLYWQSQIIFVC